MSPEKVYEDFQRLLTMNANRATKIEILELLVAQVTNNWRVVGITEAALNQLEEQGYKYKTRSGIQRAHIYDRYETFGLLIDETRTQQNFWDFISDRDRTVLAIKGEYNTVTFEQAVPIDDPGLFLEPGQTVYFPSRQVSYRHTSIERDFLRDFHAKYKAQQSSR